MKHPEWITVGIMTVPTVASQILRAIAEFHGGRGCGPLWTNWRDWLWMLTIIGTLLTGIWIGTQQ